MENVTEQRRRIKKAYLPLVIKPLFTRWEDGVLV